MQKFLCDFSLKSSLKQHQSFFIQVRIEFKHKKMSLDDDKRSAREKIKAYWFHLHKDMIWPSAKIYYPVCIWILVGVFPTLYFHRAYQCLHSTVIRHTNLLSKSVGCGCYRGGHLTLWWSLCLARQIIRAMLSQSVFQRTPGLRQFHIISKTHRQLVFFLSLSACSGTPVLDTVGL